MVWTTCMLFFQVLLLGGYLYAHLLSSLLGIRQQAMIHLTLLALSLVFLPITPSDALKPVDSQNPVGGILLLLLISIGLPFLLVSATSPLIQKWLKLTQPKRSPYRLFALSNFGSLLGLLIYPFAVEPLMLLGEQTRAWSVGYGLYAGLGAGCAVLLFRSRVRSPPSAAQALIGMPVQKIPLSTRGLWLALATCGSVMLLATTNHLCADVAVVPFLWVLPLSLYLLSFILSFQHDAWYERRIWVSALVVSLAAVVILLKQTEDVDLRLQIFIYSAALFAACMVCHGELARARPPAAHLTSYYLVIATGGALGGVFVTLLAPALFQGYWEYPLALLASYVLAALCVSRDQIPFGESRSLRVRPHLWAGGAWVLVFFLGWHVYDVRAGTLAMTRNFYGVLKVYEGDAGTPEWRRYLWHGQISHGSQFLQPSRRRTPTQYFGTETGIGLAINNHPRRQTGLRIGIVGLGTGTIATYGRETDVIRFYEINSEVAAIARDYFYYIEDSPAEVDVVLGDARISMEQELRLNGSQQFDLLAVDAFSGDAIPVHLLTREAFELYLKHLRPDGILAVHISSLYFDLKPLIRGLARELDWPAVLIENMEDPDAEVFSCEWALLTRNGEFFAEEAVTQGITPWLAETSGTPEEVVWTDDYSNLFQLLLR
jgi:hypothetical protein